MTRIMNWVHAKELSLDKKAERFASRHPCLAYLAVLMGMPICMIGAVWLSTLAIMLPFGFMLGWLS